MSEPGGTTTPGYDAFLLVSFGGPEGPEDVMPFLENVTRGRGVPRERLEAVAHHYLALDGVSPINAQNRALLAALGAELERRAIALPTYWGNRNWAPYLAPTLAQVRADGHRRVLAFTTSAYSSYSSCRQYREDLARALADGALSEELEVDVIRRYFDHPGFIRPFADGLASALAQLTAEGHEASRVQVMFTTHSIPIAMAASSGPAGRFVPDGAYVTQHRAAIDAVLRDVARSGSGTPARTALVYQSRSGSPHVPWLEPDVNDALRELRAAGATAVVIVPIGFVSDHVEVVWDLDHEARETCDELGLRMIRVATPGTHPAFVAGIVDLIEERLNNRTPEASSALGPWPARCPVDCCANPAGERPTVSGSA